uniref:Cytochrome P450 CYP94C115 n=1 Tax=Panax ginseng TaxID=4054 RepID=A0A3Q9BHN7_PANGI|nr:cytochrome P450 CYP94C115 [Panax ginseng]
MEFETCWWLQSLHASLFLLIFSIIVILLILCVDLLLKPRFYCNCSTCQTYLTLKWSAQFHNLCDWYTHLLQNSPTKTIHIHVLGNTVTANPENVEYMLKTRFDNYPKGKPFSAILGDLLGKGIFNVDGDLWRFQKKLAGLELNRISIRSYAFEVVNFEIEGRLIPLLLSFAGKNKQDSCVLDLQDVFRRFSFDSICRFSFGLDPKCLELSLPISEFDQSFDLASKLSAERAMTATPLGWKIKRFLNIGSEKELKKCIKNINILAQEVIRQRRKKGFSDDKDLLSRFMGTINDDTYLRDIVISFVLAGRDTVASALTSLFWLLANHPEVDAAIRSEADRVIGSNQELKSIEQLHYLQAAVYESMRLYPPVQFDSKFCLEDDVLPDGTLVKKGTRVTYHSYAMGRMEEIWGPDFLEFKPERWLKDGVFFRESNPFKYPVFQAGARVCLGKEMALLELKTVALSLLRRFRIELVSPSNPPRFSPGLTATFSGGLPVLVRARRDPDR